MNATRKRRATRRQQPNQRQPIEWRRYGRFALVGLFLLVAGIGVLFGYQVLHQKLDMPIREVIVDGKFEYLDSKSIEQAVAPLVLGGFLSTDVRHVQQRVVALPWVSTASVRRIWPGTLVIRVEEHQPYLRWGDNKLISRTGELYAPADMLDFMHLVKLDGDDAYHREVVEQYLELGKRLAEFGEIENLKRNSQGSWSLSLDTGISIQLGKQEIDARLGRTLRFMRHFSDQLIAVEIIDARYTNGVAIQLKQQNQINHVSKDTAS